MLILRCVAGTALGALIMFGISVASGQNYPTKPIRIITGSVGGGSDSTARHIAQEISAPLGQPVIVENRASIVATETVAKGAPDGYILLVGGASVWHTPLMHKMNYDPINDFQCKQQIRNSGPRFFLR